MTQSITTRPPESDPNASAVEALLARFPDLDRSHATEVVAWCADDGAFPEGSTLFSSDHEEAYSRGASSDLTVPVPALLGVTVTVPPFPSDPPMDVRDSELWGLAPRVVPPSLAVRASEPPMDVRDSELWDLAPRVVSPPSLAVRSSEPPMDVRDSQLRDLAARELSELPIDVTVSDAPEENELAIDVTMSVAPQENEPVIDVTVSDAPAPHDGLLETSGVGDARSDDEGAASPWFVAPAPYEPRVAATIPPPSMESMAAEEAVAAVSEGTLLAASVHGDSDPLARITVSVDSFPSVEGEPGAPIRVALRPVRRGRAGVALGVLVVTNSALAAGVLGVRAESHRDRVPVAALSAEVDRKSTRLNSSHLDLSRMPSSA